MLFRSQSTVGASAWNKLFDETLAGLEFDLEGEKVGIETLLNQLTEQKRNKREAAAHELARIFEENLKIFARVHNTLAKEKEIEDRWRGFPTAQTARHLSNHVEPEVVEALRNAVVAAYPRLSHRYYKMKARWFGVEQLDYWDRNAPLPESDEKIIPWVEARDRVLEAYGRFSPELASVGKRFFDGKWIDAPVRPGKSSGDRKSTRLNSSHVRTSRMPSSA